MLVASRLTQGVSAAMMLPAALSILTTTFSDAGDRHKALGAWGAMAGLGSAAGVLLGGVLSEGPGRRWVFLVNLPVCLIVLRATFRLVANDRRTAHFRDFDVRGAVLATGGMLLLVYTLVEAPESGWDAARTLAGLSAALAILAAFVVNELRHRVPLVPFSIFRIKGLAAANATQVIATAGFLAMFFFVTLYMQNVLGYSQIEAGAAYIPTTIGIVVAAGASSQLIARTGTRPIIVAGAVIAAGAVFHLSRVPVGGSYVTDLLPGLTVMALGLGAVFVGVTTAANAGVPSAEAGLAAALISTSQQLGATLGIAIFTAIATSRTEDLLANSASEAQALTSGFQRALLACSVVLAVAALIALRATNTRPHPALAASPTPAPRPPRAGMTADSPQPPRRER